MDRLEQLWEIEQIKQLKARYFRYLDSKQWEKFQALFTEDAEIWRLGQGAEQSDPYVQTVAEFVSSLAVTHDRDRVVSVHQGHMPEIEVVDDRHATGIWAMFDWVERPRNRVFQGYGHYFEEYEKGADGRWRIKSWRLTRLRVDLVPSVLESAPNYGFVPEFWPS